MNEDTPSDHPPAKSIQAKSPQAFRTIAEASEELDVAAHVLRFWEGKFPQLRPMKRAGGRRLYRSDDMALLRGIRAFLQDDGYQIKGVQKLMRDQGVAFVRNRGGVREDTDRDDLGVSSGESLDSTVRVHGLSAPEPAGPLFEDRENPEVGQSEAAPASPKGNAGPALGIALRKALAKLEYARTILERATQ